MLISPNIPSTSGYIRLCIRRPRLRSMYLIPAVSTVGPDVMMRIVYSDFARLAFFAVSNNVVVLYVIPCHIYCSIHSCPHSALRAMMAEFLFFIGIAAICFSGLLFTLHSLGASWLLSLTPLTLTSC